MISIARPMTRVSMKLSTRPRSEAVLGLEPETSYMCVKIGSCNPFKLQEYNSRHTRGDDIFDIGIAEIPGPSLSVFQSFILCSK